MKTMIISEFKAKCIATLKDVEKTGEPVLITRRGKPIAEVDSVQASKVRVLGSQRGSMQIKGDIVHGGFADDWNMCAEDK